MRERSRARRVEPMPYRAATRRRIPSGMSRTGRLAYLALTKPRVIELLLVTAIPAMLLAHRGP